MAKEDFGPLPPGIEITYLPANQAYLVTWNGQRLAGPISANDVREYLKRFENLSLMASSALCPYRDRRTDVKMSVLGDHRIPGGVCDGSGRHVARVDSTGRAVLMARLSDIREGSVLRHKRSGEEWRVTWIQGTTTKLRKASGPDGGGMTIGNNELGDYDLISF